ncbi:hypothetical protein ABFS82_06G186700 [Erythranthe guttata]|nr:PREDICTED: protein FLOWERING LOCUS D [Erythranthe guttata]|eukprot:XP_012834772.1 PREDICTED: protein FLOWERING LOCUS D [Erythranthe guttata]
MDSSNQNTHPQMHNQLNNPLQTTVHLPHSSIPNPNAVQNPELNPNFGRNPSPEANLVQEHSTPASITKGKRGVRRPKTASYANQVQNMSSASLNDGSVYAGVQSISSSSGQVNKAQMKISSNLTPVKHGSSSNSGISAKKTVDDMSDEIIVISKEATAEALIALSSGFPADILTDEEIEYGVVSVVGGIEQVNYILIRNHIITKWRENVSSWLTKEMFVNIVPKHCGPLLDTAYDYLVSHGYINFGVAPAMKEKVLVEPKQQNVLVIGAGLAGLAAARQLMAFGFKVTILEGRRRAGGRVYTKKLEGNNRVAAVDLGGSVLTGTLGNPLGILARQLSLTLHKVRDKCPLYGVDGTPVDPGLDKSVEDSFNEVLDTVSKYRNEMGDVAQDVSLGAALTTFQKKFNEEEMNLFNWHIANLEYANASLVSKLSLAFWDQDDPFDMGGAHCFLPGGNGRLVQALVENVPIHYEKTVQAIRYGSDGVQVVVSGGQIYKGDMVLCTVPLGVLKSRSIEFMPELPQRKLDAIKRLGFGLLNKVALLFPHAFWGTDLDTFGHLTDHPSRRGEFFLFYSYATVAGGPLLIALVAGEAAHRFEVVEPIDSVQRVLRILRDIYEPQGIEVPDPIQTVCTRWGSDPLSCGSYSNVAVGASGDDYDILAECVGDGRLFFAGEATNRRYPATMHGALLSGFREAANMAHHARVRASRSNVEKSLTQDAHTCATILADLFRQPDVEFGSFAILFGRNNAGSMAILRVTFGGHRQKQDQQYSNKVLFEQLQSHFNQQQEFHIYTLLSKQQALDLREVRGGDEARLDYLCNKLGVKLVVRKGLGPSADSVIASIKAEKSSRKTSSGTSKTKATAAKQKLIRRAKIVGGRNRLSLPKTNIESKVSNGGINAESRILPASNGSTCPVLDDGPRAFSSNNDLPPLNSNNDADFMSDIRSPMQNLGLNNGLTTTFGSNNGSSALNSNSSLASHNTNAGIMLLDETRDSNPEGFSANSLYLQPMDFHMSTLGDSSRSINQSFICSNASAAPTSSEIGTREVSNDFIMAPSNSINHGFNPQGYAADISNQESNLMNHGFNSQEYAADISNQENIFEDIMNELLPPSGSNSGTWHFAEKL